MTPEEIIAKAVGMMPIAGKHVVENLDANGYEVVKKSENARLREALPEARTDLMIVAENALAAAKTDPRWEGVYDKLMARVRECDKALAGQPVQITAEERRFPIQPTKGNPAPLSVPWSVAEIAYSQYRAKWRGTQTLERLAERGGFSSREMDHFYPGWRDCSAEEMRERAARFVAALQYLSAPDRLAAAEGIRNLSAERE